MRAMMPTTDERNHHACHHGVRTRTGITTPLSFQTPSLFRARTRKV
jgi:hypothetical protein